MYPIDFRRACRDLRKRERHRATWRTSDESQGDATLTEEQKEEVSRRIAAHADRVARDLAEMGTRCNATKGRK